MRKDVLLGVWLPMAVTTLGAGCSSYDYENDCSGTCCYMDCTPDGPTPPELEQQVFVSPVTPKPLTGGTLLVSKTRSLAIVSDPDRDRIVVADLEAGAVLHELSTETNAVPGRALELPDGRVVVVLREAGQVVTFDPMVGAESAVLTSVCEAPRGIALGAPTADGTPTAVVACAGGELVNVTFGAAPVIEQLRVLAPDLRDVVLSADRLYVSRFRSAEVEVLDDAGTTLGLVRPYGYVTINLDPATAVPSAFEPRVAWRMIPRPEGGVWLVHQHAKSTQLASSAQAPPSYGDFDCAAGVVHSAVTAFDRDGELVTDSNAGSLPGMTLPVDVALSTDGQVLAMVSAANNLVVEISASTVLTTDGCQAVQQRGPIDNRTLPIAGEPIAVAYDGDDNLVVQHREPAALEIFRRVSGDRLAYLPLGGESRLDTGHLLFHSDPDFGSAAVACASCHPEGREDGHVWFFDTGPRRTQSLAGDIRGSAPFHWIGDLSDISALMDEVFSKRMGGAQQTDERKAATESYIGAIPEAPRAAVTDGDAVERGRALFESDTVGCTDCHAGSRLTAAGTYDVGTSGAFQVPTLIGLGTRAPFMHDGCAQTLADRFSESCGGGDLHGKTSQLTAAEVLDLVAYLSSL